MTPELKQAIEPSEEELRDYIIGNLDWMADKAHHNRETVAKWLDDAIATHTRYEGKTAKEWHTALRGELLAYEAR